MTRAPLSEIQGVRSVLTGALHSAAGTPDPWLGTLASRRVSLGSGTSSQLRPPRGSGPHTPSVKQAALQQQFPGPWHSEKTSTPGKRPRQRAARIAWRVRTEATFPEPLAPCPNSVGPCCAHALPHWAPEAGPTPGLTQKDVVPSIVAKSDPTHSTQGGKKVAVASA